MFDAVCEIIQVPTDEKRRQGSNPDGSPDEEKALDFVYDNLDKMTSAQLRTLDSKIRQSL